MGGTATVETIMADISATVRTLTALPPQPEIIISDMAVEEGSERLFPVSRHRSRRVHKKLVKRFGGVFRKVPAVFKMGDKWIMHPAKWREFQARETVAQVKAKEDAFWSAYRGIRVHGMT